MFVLAKRLALAAVIVVVGALVLIWLALFSSLLAEPRGAYAERILAERLGGNLAIAGVDFSLDSGLRFNARDLVLSGSKESGANPLEITQLSVAIEWRDLMNRQLHLSDVQVSSARIALSVDADGTANWQGLDIADLPIPKTAGESSGSGWQVSLSDKQISLSDSVITYQSAVSGLDLDLEMSSVELNQSDANWNLQGDGQLNKQPVKISGALSADQSFDLSAAFDELNLKIDGKPAEGDLRSGFSANITADISKLSQLLDILKLQKPISGTGTASAVFTASGGKRSIDDLKLHVDLDSGESLNLTGKFGEIRDLNQATLKMDISLYPPDEMPAPAKLRRDLKLTGLEVVLTAQPEG
ncbi:MAG: AsmA family protein, partial [Pseudomonadota bacterium]